MCIVDDGDSKGCSINLDATSTIQDHPPPSWTDAALQELRHQFKTSGPAMAGMLINKIPWILSLHFVGNIGNSTRELAAAALATTLCNVTGMSLSVGLSSAMSTLTGQARGASISKQQKEKDAANDDEERTTLIEADEATALTVRYGATAATSNVVDKPTSTDDTPLLPMVYLYRGLFIQLMVVIPVGIWWLSGIQTTLVALGQGEELSFMTQQYLRILTPGLWAYSIHWTFSAWLQAMEMADIPAYASTVALALHIPVNLFFLHVLQWGYLGVAAATVVTQTIQPAYEVLYIFGTQQGLTRVMKNAGGRKLFTPSLFWKEVMVAVGSLSGILQYLSLALPGIVLISEWWASELSIFLAGTLLPHPDLALGAMTIYQSINASCFMFPVGCSIAGATRVSNCLGAGNVKGANLAAQVSVASASCVSLCLGCVLLFTPHTWIPSFFTPDEAVVFEASKTLPFLSIYVIGDGIQTALNGIIKGCGRQCIVMPIVLVAYWVVAIPLAYHFTFVVKGGLMCEDSWLCGITGLISGMTIGTWTHMLLLALVVGCTTNWEKEVRKAKMRLTVEQDGSGA